MGELKNKEQINKVFGSNLTHDQFTVESIDHHMQKNGHPSIVTDVSITADVIDDIIENFGLMNFIVDQYNDIGFRYILFEYKPYYTYPKFELEKVSFRGNNYTRFTTNQFKRFYAENIANILNYDKIFIDHSNRPDDDGWTVVVDKKKTKQKKMDELKKTLCELNI